MSDTDEKGRRIHTCCVNCGLSFKLNENVHTLAGLVETQISGLCENCFDDITSEEEETVAEG